MQKDNPNLSKLEEGISHEDCHAGCHHHGDEERLVPVRQDVKIGRNDPCPCESGKKYKKCCLV